MVTPDELACHDPLHRDRKSSAMQVEPDPLKLIAPSVAGAFPPSIAKLLERLCICAVAWDGDPLGSIVGGGNGVKSVG